MLHGCLVSHLRCIQLRWLSSWVRHPRTDSSAYKDRESGIYPMFAKKRSTPLYCDNLWCVCIYIICVYIYIYIDNYKEMYWNHYWKLHPTIGVAANWGYFGEFRHGLRGEINPADRWYAGWWLTYPSEKLWTSSFGMMTFPTEWEVIKFHGSKAPIRDVMLLPWSIETETISCLIIIFPIKCSADSLFLGPTVQLS